MMAEAHRMHLNTDATFTELLRMHEQAATCASETGQIQLAAMTLEALGGIAEDEDLMIVATQYYTLASAHYAKWGAKFKVHEMEEKISELREMAPLTAEQGTNAGASHRQDAHATHNPLTAAGGDRGHGAGTDIGAIVNAAQALSRCNSFDELIQELLKILVSTAGATRCVLLQRTTNGYRMPAEGLVRDAQVYVQKCNHEIPTADEQGTVIEHNTVSHDIRKFVCLAAIQFVLRSKEVSVIQNTQASELVAKDNWLLECDTPPKCLLAAPILNQGELKGVVYLENSVTTGVFTQAKLDVIDTIATQVSISIENIQSTEALLAQKEAFARFFPKEFLDLMGKSDVTKIDVNEGKTFHLSVLFSDIRNFTKMSEGMEAGEVFKLLNDYHQKIAPICRKWGGFIDKFIGDAIMALFPRSSSDAISAAVEMQRGIKDFNASNAHRKPIGVGVGVQYGMAMLGTVGESHRMEGTVIGDCVNTASRLEGLTKAFQAPILTSGEAISTAVDDSQWIGCNYRQIGLIALQGKAVAMEIYEVFSGEDAQAGKCDDATLSRALQLFKNRQFAECKLFFQEVVSQHYNDTHLVKFYTSACDMYSALASKLPADWRGTVWVDKDGEAKQPDGIALKPTPKRSGNAAPVVSPVPHSASPSPNPGPAPTTVGTLTPSKAALLRQQTSPHSPPLASPFTTGMNAWDGEDFHEFLGGGTEEAYSTDGRSTAGGRVSPFATQTSPSPTMSSMLRPKTAPTPVISDEDLRNEFNMYDINGNGWLSIKEMEEIYNSFECYSVEAERVPGAKMRQVLSSLGMGDDERIRYDQFALIMLKLLQL
eukprot:TRINITY_DN34050_c0_g1_i1.p1 TRINITY_DN34050_c0_g1~~TRINITY_DN34050_c0_g1_i1.p1  ORF type:complete len:856 (-),score=97.92 TRINITY_DN34050_c0_g1_i1:749-3220(-)